MSTIASRMHSIPDFQKPRQNLCAFCNQIDLDTLENPSTSDLPMSIEGQTDRIGHSFKSKPAGPKPIKLGTLADIRHRGQTCPLCRLIGQVMNDHNETSGFDSEDHRIYLAETSPYGVYYDPSDHQHWVHRLSIIVEYDGSKVEYDQAKSGRPGRHIYFAFQACNFGAAAIQTSESVINPLPDSDMMLFGGRKRPLLLNFRWVLRWIEICEAKHIKCRREDLNSEDWPPQIRFIDVKERCIVTLANGDCRYVALSYVWGGNQKVTLTSFNAMELAQPGALSRGSISQTIEDSILVAEKLDINYLWVDALCIIQNDDNDKEAQIKAMGHIYSCAFLTIVAASAPNANGGLPGLRSNTRFFQQDEVEVRPGLSLMKTVHPLIRKEDHFLEHTPWNSRGWTLQERVLSRRMLIFGKEQVYWVCREANFCEESYFENDLRFIRTHAQALEPALKRSFRNFYEPKDQPEKWVNYRQLVTHYTRRSFTCNGDVFNAFSALLQGFHSIWGEEFIWGMPRSHFEEGLLWSTFTGQSRREDLSTLPMTSKQVKVAFPSWSWMGWIGETDICIDDDRSDGQLTETLYFLHQHDPFLNIVRVGTAAASYGSGGRHNRYVTLADLESNHPRLRARLDTIAEEQLIFFWTSSATFYLKDDESHLGGPSVLDCNGKIVGSTGVMPRNADASAFDQACEFIVVGSRRNDFSDPTLLVLLIKWEDDIAYRVSISEIFEEAWLKALPTWKLIPLG